MRSLRIGFVRFSYAEIDEESFWYVGSFYDLWGSGVLKAVEGRIFYDLQDEFHIR